MCGVGKETLVPRRMVAGGEEKERREGGGSGLIVRISLPFRSIPLLSVGAIIIPLPPRMPKTRKRLLNLGQSIFLYCTKENRSRVEILVQEKKFKQGSLAGTYLCMGVQSG